MGCPEAGVHRTNKLRSLFKDEYLSVSQLLLEYFKIYVNSVMWEELTMPHPPGRHLMVTHYGNAQRNLTNPLSEGIREWTCLEFAKTLTILGGVLS